MRVVRIDARLSQDLLGRGQANAVDVGQADFNALVARKVDTNKTCHRFISSFFLALTLLMTGVLADNEDLAMASNDLALVAHFLDRGRTFISISFRLMRSYMYTPSRR